MSNLIKAFIAPHIDESYNLCQDRLYVNPETLFFAVSDGVSSSFSPTYYAKLISSYENYGNVKLQKKDAIDIYNNWKAYLEILKKEGRLGRGSLQRYNRGEVPAATYARMNFTKSGNDWHWNAAVLGDCSILYFNFSEQNYEPKKVILSGEKFKNNQFNYVLDKDFYTFGKLPSQLNPDGDFLYDEVSLLEMPLYENDCFILMTDGLSDWVLKDPSSIAKKVQSLMEISSQIEFLEFIEKWRNTLDERGEREVENDDISLIVISIDEFTSDVIFEENNISITDIDDRISFEKEIKTRNKYTEQKLVSSRDDLLIKVQKLSQQKSNLTTEVEGLNKQKLNLTTEVEGLNKQKSNLTTEVEGLNKQKSNLTTEVEGLNRQKLNLTTEVEGLNKQKLNLTTEVEGLNKQKLNLTTEVEGSNKQKPNLTTEVEGLNKQKSNLTTEVEDIRDQEPVGSQGEKKNCLMNRVTLMGNNILIIVICLLVVMSLCNILIVFGIKNEIKGLVKTEILTPNTKNIK